MLRRLTLVLGIVLIVGGLAVLGYVGWQLWGTDVISHRHQRQVTQQLREAWDSGSTTTASGWGDAEALIRIPRFGDDYEIPVLEGTDDAVLGAGFGHFTGTAGPGEPGNYALAAHRITHGEPLRHLPDLEVGDEVQVLTQSTTYVYRLVTAGDALRVPFTATWVIDPVPANPDGGVEPPQQPGQALITLTTCAELFHTDDRLIAFGVLESAAPRQE